MNKSTKYLLSLAGILGAATASADPNLYKCRSSDGKVTWSWTIGGQVAGQESVNYKGPKQLKATETRNVETQAPADNITEEKTSAGRLITIVSEHIPDGDGAYEEATVSVLLPQVVGEPRPGHPWKFKTTLVGVSRSVDPRALRIGALSDNTQTTRLSCEASTVMFAL